jgi:hypothetical protein
MIFDDPTRTRLLGSIEASNLVLLCGAGLSIPTPSGLMSAVQVSRSCYDKYLPIMALPVAMRDNVERLAEHFYNNGEFESLFLGTLVPWNDLVGQPNKGHAAVADFLICGAAAGALSANFDPLIEHWANDRKIAMLGALTGQEATTPGKDGGPLVKFHGCLVRDRNKTLWAKAQLAEPAIAARIASCSQWMGLTLPGKDLVVVGFWTDWGYLNDVIATALNVNPFSSVTVIDPKSGADLQTTAPALWARLTAGTPHFQHVQASGADALEELRTAFSKVWAKKFYALGKTMLEAEGKPYSAIDPVMSSEDFYSFRQDAEGIPYHRAAKLKAPSAGAAAAAFLHLLLIEAKAVRRGSWYEYGGKLIRIVQGAGEAISTVRERYREPPAALQPDIVVCAGAMDIPVPGHLIASGAGASVVRPGAGGGIPWLTLDQARGELTI